MTVTKGYKTKMFIALLMSTINSGKQLAEGSSAWISVAGLFEISSNAARMYNTSHASVYSDNPHPVKHYTISEYEEILLQEEAKRQHLV